MAKAKAFLLPVFAVLAVLAVGVALIVYVPTPEERAWRQLLEIRIASISGTNMTLDAAVAELNSQIQKTRRTPYRVVVATDAERDRLLTFDLKDISAAECAGKMAELSVNERRGTPDGAVIYPFFRGDRYSFPTWHSKVRYWILVEVPNFWNRFWYTAPYNPNDPFAPAGSP